MGFWKKEKPRRDVPADPKTVRLAVAKDVLEHLDAIEPSNRTWLRLFASLGDEVQDLYKARDAYDLSDVVDLVAARRVKCNACVVGACLMSYANLYGGVPLPDTFRAGTKDEIKYGHVGAFGLMRERLGAKETELLELAFERGGGRASQWEGNSEAENKLRRAAVDFGFRYANSRDRFRAIMENVVAHHGDFVPDDDPKQTEVDVLVQTKL